MYLSNREHSLQFHKFLQDLDELRECKVLPCTLVLKDPVGNSFIGTLNSEGDPEDDPNLLVEVSSNTSCDVNFMRWFPVLY